MSDEKTGPTEAGPHGATAPREAPAARRVVEDERTSDRSADHLVGRPIDRISSEQLLRGATEIHIEHRGSIYRLKQTSLGKLILTK